jgi:hypothetical protein
VAAGAAAAVAGLALEADVHVVVVALPVLETACGLCSVRGYSKGGELLAGRVLAASRWRSFCSFLLT